MKKQMKKTMALVILTGLCANSAHAGIWESIAAIKIWGYNTYQCFINKKSNKEACKNLVELLKESEAKQFLNRNFFKSKRQSSNNFLHKYHKGIDQIEEVACEEKRLGNKSTKISLNKDRPSYASVLKGEHIRYKKVDKELLQNLVEMIELSKARNNVKKS